MNANCKENTAIKIVCPIGSDWNKEENIKNKYLNCLVSVILILTIDTTTVKPTPPYT